ncbi:hypothetical protein NI454_08095 [Brevundimonas diminuta]|uniref:hypothetical protein n=1 Tax=Brevundimonas diminuta TaxID=293 RepID=UPI002097C236|nr:hypothetical protein [Brevundimonas diminuta]MCO8029915.1 hypothetical protein [Brevundimonas diminuta]
MSLSRNTLNRASTKVTVEAAGDPAGRLLGLMQVAGASHGQGRALHEPDQLAALGAGGRKALGAVEIDEGVTRPLGEVGEGLGRIGERIGPVGLTHAPGRGQAIGLGQLQMEKVERLSLPSPGRRLHPKGHPDAESRQDLDLVGPDGGGGKVMDRDLEDPDFLRQARGFCAGIGHFASVCRMEEPTLSRGVEFASVFGTGFDAWIGRPGWRGQLWPNFVRRTISTYLMTAVGASQPSPPVVALGSKGQW